MRKSKFSEYQIVTILKSVEGGRTVVDVCVIRNPDDRRRVDVSNAPNELPKLRAAFIAMRLLLITSDIEIPDD